MSVHLTAGAAFAKGLEVTRKRYFDHGEPFDIAIAKGAAALITEYGRFEPHPHYDRKDVYRTLGAMGHYFIEWPIDKIITPYKPQGADRHCIEFSFAAPTGVKHPQSGELLIYAGRFDFIGTYQDSLIIGVDDKTASQLGQSWLQQWPLANQTMGYTWGAAQNGLKLNGFLVRGTSLLTNGYGHSEALNQFARWKLDMFERELNDTLQSMVKDWERGAWRMDLGSSCSSYGGCPYLMLCDSATPEDWIPVNFIERVWNPLASRD